MVLLAAATAEPEPTAARAPTALALRAAPATVTWPAATVLAGTVSVPGARLVLQSRPAGGGAWQPLTLGLAGADGAFRFVQAPAASTEYRVVFPGDAGHAPAAAAVTVGVRPLVTMTAPAEPWLGDTVTLRCRVVPAHPGAPVTVERRRDGVWQPFLEAALDADSRLVLPWRPATYGFYRLRLRLAADGDHLAGTSPARLVIVNRPNAHGVPYKYPHYIVIVVHEYRLYYYEHGGLVRRFDVALGRPGYPTPLGLFRIRAKRKPGGGALGSCVMYYWRSIAIHGTNEPWLLKRPVPRAFSHGCARMYDREALWLYGRCPLGTPVHNLP